MTTDPLQTRIVWVSASSDRRSPSAPRSPVVQIGGRLSYLRIFLHLFERHVPSLRALPTAILRAVARVRGRIGTSRARPRLRAGAKWRFDPSRQVGRSRRRSKGIGSSGTLGLGPPACALICHDPGQEAPGGRQFGGMAQEARPGPLAPDDKPTAARSRLRHVGGPSPQRFLVADRILGDMREVAIATHEPPSAPRLGRRSPRTTSGHQPTGGAPCSGRSEPH